MEEGKGGRGLQARDSVNVLGWPMGHSERRVNFLTGFYSFTFCYQKIQLVNMAKSNTVQ